ncbi:unnamed protein product [Rhizophagus irregularis]|nr:unnamed protein product [Rhizophagus irregularis]
MVKGATIFDKNGNEKTETILNIGKEVNQTTQQHIEDGDKTEDTPPHNGEEIDQFYMTEVSEDELFAVTYSKEDESVVGWLINIKNDINLQRLDTCSNLEIPTKTEFVLHEKDLLLYNNDTKYANLISFKSGNATARRIKVETNYNFIREFKMGFLPNGDLILVSSVVHDHMIFLYSRENLSSPQLLYKIRFQSSNKYEVDYVNYYILQTKLFIFNDGFLTQWDLSPKTPKKEMHYDLTSNIIIKIVINKNQTLLKEY